MVWSCAMSHPFAEVRGMNKKKAQSHLDHAGLEIRLACVVNDVALPMVWSSLKKGFVVPSHGVGSAARGMGGRRERWCSAECPSGSWSTSPGLCLWTPHQGPKRNHQPNRRAECGCPCAAGDRRGDSACAREAHQRPNR